MKVKDFYEYINTVAPFDTAAPWDNTGLLVGNPDEDVTKVLICLDVTDSEIRQAVKENAQLIISHHPVIFKAQKSFLKGNAAFDAAVHGISVISAHTNLDKAPDGVNDALCNALGLDYEKVDFPVADGFLNVGALSAPADALSLAAFIRERLHGTVSFCDGGRKISRVGVLSGSGADFIDDALSLGCEGFITGDASYHDFLDAKAKGISLFAAGHFETEVIILDVLREKLKQKFLDTEFVVSERKNPVFTVI